MNTIPKTKQSSSDYFSKPLPLSDKFVNPKRDWMILLILLSIFIVSSMGFDYYMYEKIVSGDMYISVKREDLTIESLKSGDLKKVLDIFEMKKINITKLKLENLVDPSI